MIRQVTHICKWFLTKAILPSLLIILLLESLYGALGRDEYCEAHLPCICCKVKSWTSLEGRVILLYQNSASVWNFLWNCTPPFDMISLAFYLEIWLAYIFFYEPSCAHHFFYTLGPSCVPTFFRPSCVSSFFLYFGAFMCPYFFWRPSCVSSFFSVLCIALSVSFTMIGDHISRTWSIYVMVMKTYFSVFPV